LTALNWRPSFRSLAEEDFEDRYARETGLTVDQTSLESYLSGADLDYNPFLAIAWHDGGTEALKDWALRHAAVRGSKEALFELANNLYESGRDDSESWRWAKRFQFALRQPRSEFELGAEEEHEGPSQTVKNLLVILETENSNLAKLPEPQDVGEPGVYNYCLRCGRWRNSSTPLGQCDDDAHLVPVRLPVFAMSNEPTEAAGAHNSSFCENCGDGFKGSAAKFCTSCGHPRSSG
jgi:hypothetical protein